MFLGPGCNEGHCSKSKLKGITFSTSAHGSFQQSCLVTILTEHQSEGRRSET